MNLQVLHIKDNYNLLLKVFFLVQVSLNHIINAC